MTNYKPSKVMPGTAGIRVTGPQGYAPKPATLTRAQAPNQVPSRAVAFQAGRRAKGSYRTPLQEQSNYVTTQEPRTSQGNATT